jgi:hypothetical protein
VKTLVGAPVKGIIVRELRALEQDAVSNVSYAARQAALAP